MISDSNRERVSVIVPAYNSGQTLERCLLSIVGQTQQPTEILVYDDCSTDNTFAIAQAMAALHPTIRVFSGEVNLGAGHARTVLLQNASGDYFAFLDADDVWHTDKLAHQMKAIRVQSLDICICSYEIRDQGDVLLGRRAAAFWITFATMHLADWIPTSMAIVRADLSGSRRMPEIRRRQDYAYWLTIFKKNNLVRVGKIDQVLGTYYRSNTSLSSNKYRNLQYNYKMFREIMGYRPLIAALCVSANIVVRLFRT